MTIAPEMVCGRPIARHSTKWYQLRAFTSNQTVTSAGDNHGECSASFTATNPKVRVFFAGRCKSPLVTKTIDRNGVHAQTEDGLGRCGHRIKQADSGSSPGHQTRTSACAPEF